MRAFNGAGVSSWTNTATASTPGQVPAAPTNLIFVSSTRSTITTVWTSNSTNEHGFTVERATAGAGGPFTRLGSVAAGVTTATNRNLSANTTYWYRVRAFNADGNSSYTNVVSGKTLP